MMVKSFFLSESRELKPLDPQSIEEMCRASDARVWVDLQYSGLTGLEEWLGRLGVKGLMRKICIEARDRSGLYPLKNELLLVIPVRNYANDTDASEAVDHIGIYFRENLLLTFHRKSILDEERMARLQELDDWFPARSIAALVSGLLMNLSVNDLQRTQKLRGSILFLGERLVRNPDTVRLEEILNLRTELLELVSVLSDQVPPVQALSVLDRPFFELNDTREFLNCALVNLKAAELSLTWLDQHLDAMFSSFQMHSQDKTNRRLGILTILSAIFMPITLLAGIWGMNFEFMPELKLPFAYPVALGLMAALGVGMFYFFRKKGWFN
jgi:magnesium transporter